MKHLLNRLGLGEPDSFDALKSTIVLLWAPVVLTTWRVYGSRAFYLERLAPHLTLAGDTSLSAELYTFATAFVLLGLVSLLIIRLGFREPLAAYGLCLGDWRYGLGAVAVLGPVMTLLSWSASTSPGFLAEYPLDRGACASAPAFLGHAAAYLAYYCGFEVFFRGLLQHGVAGRLGVWPAILVQTGLSCLLHIGKPAGELYGAIVGGVLFGVVVARSRSILPVIIVHWILGVSLDLLICIRALH